MFEIELFIRIKWIWRYIISNGWYAIKTQPINQPTNKQTNKQILAANGVADSLWISVYLQEYNITSLYIYNYRNISLQQTLFFLWDRAIDMQLSQPQVWIIIVSILNPRHYGSSHPTCCWKFSVTLHISWEK